MYNRPYTIVQDNEIQNYIESSNYWADELATLALADYLKINVITIEKDKNGLIKCSYGIFDKQNQDKWNKYLFLYYESGHYELITFTYNYYIIQSKKDKNTTQKLRKLSNETFSIFERNDINNIPPLFILLLIYSTYYIDINNKQNFSFMPEILSAINSSFENIVQKATTNKDENSIKQLNIFYKYFPSKTLKTIINTNQTNNTEQSGGVLLYNKNQPYPPYNQPYPQYNQNYNYRPPYNQPYNRYNQNYPSYNLDSTFYRPTYRNRFFMNQPPAQIYTKPEDKSNIAYYITVDMELHPGTKLSPEELSQSKCIQRKNAVRKSLSTLTGKPYIIPPVYKFYPYKNKTKKNTNDNNNNNNNKNDNNKTQKNNYGINK
jgi:hypothetical protein